MYGEDREEKKKNQENFGIQYLIFQACVSIISKKAYSCRKKLSCSLSFVCTCAVTSWFVKQVSWILIWFEVFTKQVFEWDRKTYQNYSEVGGTIL